MRASDSSSALVTISQIKPIAVLFNLPQQDLDRVNAAFAKGPLPVEAQRPATGEVIAHGKLTVIDNQVDSTTGTVKLKAEFPNPNLQLWPGQFVNVRLLIDTLKNVVVVPTAAVQRGPKGAFVYVVGSDDKAAVHLVKVAKQDENQAVIASGVDAAGARGHHRLRAVDRRQAGQDRRRPRRTGRPGARPQGRQAEHQPGAGGRRRRSRGG